MVMRSSQAAAVVFTLIIGGCSTVSDTIWPSLTGDEPKTSAAGTQPIPIAPSVTERNPLPTLDSAAAAISPPVLGTNQFVPETLPEFPPTGTFVGQKIQTLRAELVGLQAGVRQRNARLQQIRLTTSQNAQRYHGTVAAVNARLQLGTTPGNPILVSQWNQAQADLDRINNDVAAMNSLANDISSDASISAFLLESTRATYGLAGAVDEDHRQLRVLEDQINRHVVLIDRLLNELSDDVGRQTGYVSNERRNLNTLALAVKNGELYGSSLSNRAFSTAARSAAAPRPAAGASAGVGGRKPLVVIRFDRPDVPYEQALYGAISQALDRRPTATFGLVAVSPAAGNSAAVALGQSRSRQHAEQVLRTLIDMGLPPSRVDLSATTSAQVATNEVHIFVR